MSINKLSNEFLENCNVKFVPFPHNHFIAEFPVGVSTISFCVDLKDTGDYSSVVGKFEPDREAAIKAVEIATDSFVEYAEQEAKLLTDKLFVKMGL